MLHGIITAHALAYLYDMVHTVLRRSDHNTMLQFKKVCSDKSEVVSTLRSHFSGGGAVMEVVQVFTHKDQATTGLEGEALEAAKARNEWRQKIRDEVEGAF